MGGKCSCLAGVLSWVISASSWDISQQKQAHIDPHQPKSQFSFCYVQVIASIIELSVHPELKDACHFT
jgi:hypothetical protein